MKQSIHFLAYICLILTVYVIGWAQKPELVVQTGHSDQINLVAFSPDGKLLASASNDSTIKLWDAAAGTELRTLKGHRGNVETAVFSPDGKILASSCSADGLIKLWDVVTGREVRTLAMESLTSADAEEDDNDDSRFSLVAFSPDGKMLASIGGKDSVIKLWDVATGKLLPTFAGHSESAISVAFSPNGKMLAGGSPDKTIKLWDVASGTELRTLKGHSKGVNLMTFSPDGTILTSADSDSIIKVWDVAKGMELQEHNASGHPLAFSPNGKLLAGDDPDHTIKLWDVATAKVVRTFTGHSEMVNSVAFSPDGKILASGDFDGAIKLWDVATSRERHTLRGHSSVGFSVAFSPDRKLIASSNKDGTIKLWDIATGAGLRPLYTGSFSSGGLNVVAFSPDGKLLASGNNDDDEIKLWDVATGKVVNTLPDSDSMVGVSVAFSPAGKILATGSDDGTIKLWDIATAKVVRTLTGHSDGVDLIVFSPDGRMLATGSEDKTIKLWDVLTGKALHTIRGYMGGFFSLAFSPNGKMLAGGKDGAVTLWDVTTGRALRQFKGDPDAVLSLVTAVAFSPDGKILAHKSDVLARGRSYSRLKLQDVLTGRELLEIRGNPDFVISLAFSSDGKILIGGNFDVNIKLWEVSSGQELANLVALDENDWIVATPDGLFDGSPGGWQKLVWLFNNNTSNYAPVEAFFGDFYYPGLLAQIFAGKRPKAPSDISQKDRRQPQLRLTLGGAEPDSALTSRDVTVKIDVSQAPAGAQDVRLFRNGSLVKVWHGDVLNGQKSVVLEATVAVVAGENRLTAYAFNRDNIKSSDATLLIKGADSLKRQGTAYILAVGINSYSNPQYNLKYAVADAEAFSAEFKRQQEILKNYARVEVISLSDKDATKANMIQSLAQLAGRVQPEDAVIIYFAGHGTAQENRFYLIPHDLGYGGLRSKLDEVGLRNILSHSVSDRELEQAFEKIDSGQILLVIDACNSGQALEAEEKRRGPMNSKGLAQLAYEKGMYIMTAAQSYQAAQEASRLGHGYLTYALVVEGLKAGAADDAPKDNTVFVREWLDYATNRVPQMQLEKLKQARNLREDFSFVEGEARDLAPEKREVQRPRVFYRRELEASPLVVARTQAASPGK